MCFFHFYVIFSYVCVSLIASMKIRILLYLQFFVKSLVLAFSPVFRFFLQLQSRMHIDYERVKEGEDARSYKSLLLRKFSSSHQVMSVSWFSTNSFLKRFARNQCCKLLAGNILFEITQ